MRLVTQLVRHTQDKTDRINWRDSSYMFCFGCMCAHKTICVVPLTAPAIQEGRRNLMTTIFNLTSVERRLSHFQFGWLRSEVSGEIFMVLELSSSSSLSLSSSCLWLIFFRLKLLFFVIIDSNYGIATKQKHPSVGHCVSHTHTHTHTPKTLHKTKKKAWLIFYRQNHWNSRSYHIILSVEYNWKLNRRTTNTSTHWTEHDDKR